MIFGEIRKRHFELVRLPVNPAPLPQASGPRQVLGIGTIKQQGLHRQAEFNEILNVRKALTCTFGHRVRSGGGGQGCKFLNALSAFLVRILQTFRAPLRD